MSSKKVEKQPRNVLVVGAHPDDLEYGVGMLLKHHADSNDDILEIVVSDGATRGDCKKRKSETTEAASTLGISECYFLDLPDGTLPRYKEDLEIKLREFREEKEFDFIYTHTLEDRHQDHVIVSEAICSVFRGCVRNILLYASPSILPTYSPNAFFIGNKDLLDFKLKALQAHTTQIGSIINGDDVCVSAKFWFNRAQNYGGGGFAEPLEIYSIDITQHKLEGGVLIVAYQVPDLQPLILNMTDYYLNNGTLVYFALLCDKLNLVEPNFDLKGFKKIGILSSNNIEEVEVKSFLEDFMKDKEISTVYTPWSENYQDKTIYRAVRAAARRVQNIIAYPITHTQSSEFDAVFQSNEVGEHFKIERLLYSP